MEQIPQCIVEFYRNLTQLKFYFKIFKMEQRWSRSHNAGQVKSGKAKSRQVKSRHIKLGQVKSGQGNHGKVKLDRGLKIFWTPIFWTKDFLGSKKQTKI